MHSLNFAKKYWKMIQLLEQIKSIIGVSEHLRIVTLADNEKNNSSVNKLVMCASMCTLIYSLEW